MFLKSLFTFNILNMPLSIEYFVETHIFKVIVRLFAMNEFVDHFLDIEIIGSLFYNISFWIKFLIKNGSN